MGLLPNLANDFQVSIPKAGVLVTGYALSVTIGAPIVAIATARLERKLTLLLLMGVFTLGNLACAIVPKLQPPLRRAGPYRPLPWSLLRHRQRRGRQPRSSQPARPGYRSHVLRTHSRERPWRPRRHGPRSGLWLALGLLGHRSYWIPRRCGCLRSRSFAACQLQRTPPRIPRSPQAAGSSRPGHERPHLSLALLRLYLHCAHARSRHPRLSSHGHTDAVALRCRHHHRQLPRRHAHRLAPDDLSSSAHLSRSSPGSSPSTSPNPTSSPRSQ